MSVTTLTCPTCSRPLRQQQVFCEACGARATDRPVPRSRPEPPRIPAPRQVHMQEILTPKTARTVSRSKRRVGLWVTTVALLLAAGLTLGALSWTGALGGSQTEAEKQAEELARSQAELRPALAAFMRTRATFFSAERRYLPAMNEAREAISKYNKKLADVEDEIDDINAANASRLRGCGTSCPDLDYPAYPKTPKLGPEMKDLKAVVRRTGELHTQLNAIRDPGVLTMAYSELLSAVDLLGQDAENNLTVLQDMLDRPKEELYGGGVARLRIRTLSGNSSLPVIRRMNRNLVRLLERTRLPVTSYDLPGGKDTFRADHSVST